MCRLLSEITDTFFFLLDHSQLVTPVRVHVCSLINWHTERRKIDVPHLLCSRTQLESNFLCSFELAFLISEIVFERYVHLELWEKLLSPRSLGRTPEAGNRSKRNIRKFILITYVNIWAVEHRFFFSMSTVTTKCRGGGHSYSTHRTFRHCELRRRLIAQKF